MSDAAYTPMTSPDSKAIVVETFNAVAEIYDSGWARDAVLRSTARRGRK